MESVNRLSQILLVSLMALMVVVGPVASEDECVNKHSGGDAECDDWASGLQCDINPSYMGAYCAKACGVCGGAKPTIDTATCYNTESDIKCEEARLTGLCQEEAGTYLRTCRKTCGNCRANCKDENEKCALWKESGHCESNPGYTLIHCQDSCKVCA